MIRIDGFAHLREPLCGNTLGAVPALGPALHGVVRPALLDGTIGSPTSQHVFSELAALETTDGADFLEDVVAAVLNLGVGKHGGEAVDCVSIS